MTEMARSAAKSDLRTFCGTRTLLRNITLELSGVEVVRLE
jgi:hypothetical protein